ncbi:Uncharacterized protein HZ326_12489 [Fusarium oxysporum f. sp. albedinis]|nr:Uncharacterized protein HZ326_12489 [Fusarium oxysporum f. sp. albedinis]
MKKTAHVNFVTKMIDLDVLQRTALHLLIQFGQPSFRCCNHLHSRDSITILSRLDHPAQLGSAPRADLHPLFHCFIIPRNTY